jgi:DNA-binding transcriptional LysR family regulator
MWLVDRPDWTAAGQTLLRVVHIRSAAIRPVDANLLMILAVLLQTRSISRAAKRMGMSQPTVSRALGQLRATLADPLLVRSGGKMTLTQRAMELAQPLEDWLAATSTVLQPASFTPATLDRRFVVAASDYGVLSVINPAMRAVHAGAPGCRLEIAPYTQDMFHKLAVGEIDMVVHGFSSDRPMIHAHRLFAETQSIIVRRDHPLAQGGERDVPLDRYLEWPHIAVSIGPEGYDHVAHCLAGRSEARKVRIRVPYFYAACDLISSSDAILTMPTRAAIRFAHLYGLACLPAPEEIVGFDYWALVHERSVRDLAIRWLIGMLAATEAKAAALPVPALAAMA